MDNMGEMGETGEMLAGTLRPSNTDSNRDT